MSGFQITITDAGRAALIDAQNTGTVAFRLSQIGVSTQHIDAGLPALTLLPNERKRLSTMAGDVVADDTLHVTIRDETADAYALRAFGLYTSTGVLFAVYSQTDPILEKSDAAMLLLAIDAKLVALGTAQIEFGPAGFSLPPASESLAGIVEIATDAEVDAGVDPWRVITVRTLKRALAALSGFALLGHKHDAADTTTGVFNVGRIPALDMSKITGLVIALAGKAADVHTHAISQILGLTEALAGKAASIHQHAADDIVSGVLAVGRIPALAMEKITGLAVALAGKASLDASVRFSDVRASRGAGTGVVYFGESDDYLLFQGGQFATNHPFNAPALTSGGNPVWHSVNFNPALFTPLRPAHDIGSPNTCPEGLSGGDANLGAGIRGYAYLTHHQAAGQYSAQLALPDTGEEVFIRRRSEGVWQPWHQIHTSASFNPTTKADANDWTSPAAEAVITGYKAFSSFGPSIAGGDRGALEVRGQGFAGAAAFMSFHRPGVQAGHFGLDNDGQWKVGGWNYGAASYRLLHEANMDLWWPAGEMKFYDSASPPAGARALVANGAAVSRSTYARLFAVIGTRYGGGDGASTFNLPDWRGLFVRGLDNGRGLDPGRTLGSYQDSQNLSHTHIYTYVIGVDNTQAGSGVQGGWAAGGAETDPSGGAEARPRNTALLACITY